MKLQDKENQVEQGAGQILIEHEMEIQKEDQHVILGIVSHKMYSNAIRTIIQEVGCNARDAHREHGNEDRPIKVKLPDRNDNSFYIQDFGVGVDPERMAKVFVNYGASTKRNSNDETGGFGLGAKSPFSYTDQFGIVTVTPDDDGTMMLRQYMAIFEGKRRIVKLIESRPARTDEERGTKIIIPVKPEDFDKFRQWAIDRYRYWTVKPELISRDNPVVWPKDEVDFEADDSSWQVMKVEYDRYGYRKSGSSEDRKPKAVVDGIPYPISRESVERSGLKSDLEINKLWGFPVLLHFNTGDVSMTATREELDYTVEATGKAIRERFESIIKELKKKLNDKIATADSFVNASIEWNKIKNQYNSIVSSVKWNGHEITGNGMQDNNVCNLIHYKPDATKHSGMTRGKAHRLPFEENAKIILDDTGKKGIQTSKIGKLFDDNPNVTDVYIVQPKEVEDIYSGSAIYKTKKDFAKNGTKKDIIKWLKKETQLDLYKPLSMESLPKRKPKTRAKGSGNTGVNAKVIRVLDPNDWRVSCWNKTELDYKDDSGYIVFLKSHSAYLNNNFTGYIAVHLLKEAAKTLGISVHGVLSAHAKKIGKGWTPLLDHIKAEHTRMKKELDNMKVPSSFHPYSTSVVKDQVASFYGLLPKDGELFKMIDKWKNNDSEIAGYREKADKFNKIVEVLQKIDPANKDDYKLIDFTSQKDSINYETLAKQRYPFLANLTSWYCKVSDKERAEYVEIMDAHLGPISY